MIYLQTVLVRKYFTIMKKTTFLLLVTAVALLVPSGALAQKSHLQPLSGTMYQAADSATQNNPQAELTFDEHGNLTAKITCSFSKMNVEGHDYDYSKGYRVLLNDYWATIQNSGNDTTWTQRTWLNDRGVRTRMMVYSNTTNQEETGFSFDDLGHITSFDMEGDSTRLTWDGERLKTYNHTVKGWGTRVTTLDSVSVAFGDKPFDAMQYDYDDLLYNYTTYHTFINGSGTFSYHSTWPKADLEGNIDISTTVKPNGKWAEQLVMLNDTDTLCVQTWEKLDKNGSFKLTMRQPVLYPDQVTYHYLYYNVFGDLVQQLDSIGYSHGGETSWEVSHHRELVDYEGVKPLRRMFYNWDDASNDWSLGYLYVFTEWNEKPADPVCDPVVVDRHFSAVQVPQSGSMYAKDDPNYENAKEEYTYDDHFNMTSKTSGSMSSSDVEEWEYNYSKGYPFLSSHLYYTLKKGEKTDEHIYWQTTYDENGIRTGITGMDQYGEQLSGYHFDALGHVDSLITESDSTILTWDGESLKSYYYYNYPGSWAALKIDLKDITIGYADRPFDAMQSSYNNLIEDFKTYHACINANGTYYKKDYSGNELEGTLTVRTRVSDDQQDVYSVAIVNGLDTIAEQKIHFTDSYGSFNQTVRYPYDGTYEYGYSYTYNEFGNLIKTSLTEPSYSGGSYTTVTEDTMIYEGNKPLRMEHYYYQEGYKTLGYTIVYDDWIADGIHAARQDLDTTKGADLYTIDGRKVASLSASQLQSANLGLSLQGLYILRQGNSAKKIILHK